MQDGTAFVTIEGFAPDVAGLSKLFPDIETAELIVNPPSGVTITPEPSGNGFNVDTHELARTRVNGPGVQEALKSAKGRFKADALARISQQLNAAGLLCDPEFRPISATSWGIKKPGGSSYGIPDNPDKSYRKRTSHGRVKQHLDMASHAAKIISENETAERVLYLLNTKPGWVGLNIILEAIAWHEGVKPLKLDTINLAPKGFVSAFQNAANNARDQNEDPRHFPTRTDKPNKSDKVTLGVARVTIAKIVHYWMFEYLTVKNSETHLE